MIEITDKNKCCGCEACSNICPKKCITMKQDEEGFLYPVVDKEKCINCGICNKVCQYENSVMEIKRDQEPEVYSCIIKNKKELKNSTTAAVFFNMAKYVIKTGGVVYGAKYDSNMKVIHTRTDIISELEELRGSKYVQSEIGKVYNLVKQDLKDNKKVLFSGTPCQVGGLYKFLGMNNKNLITIDIICYGVPSPKIYQDYIKKLEKENNSKVIHIDFRDKTHGWKNIYTKIKFQNEDKRYFKPSKEDEWYNIFISHIATRKSCSNCLYTSLYRKSDITIGDFWGIEKIDKQIDTYNAVSKVLINTKKGADLFTHIEKKYEVKKRNLEDAIRPNLQHPPKENSRRTEFFKVYYQKGYKKAYSKFVRQSLINKVKRKILRKAQ